MSNIKLDPKKAIDLLSNDKSEEWNKTLNDIRGEFGLNYMYVEITGQDFGTRTFDGFDLENCSLRFNRCIFNSSPMFSKNKKIGAITFFDCNSIGDIDIREAVVGALSIYTSPNNATLYPLGKFSISGNSRVLNSILISGYRIEHELNIQDSHLLPEGTNVPNVQIANCVVAGPVCFDNIEMGPPFAVHGCVFEDTFHAKSSTFHGRAKFINCTFKDFTDFRGTRFVLPPQFGGSSLHEHTLFPREDRFDITKKAEAEDLDQDIEALRTLRNHASRLMNRRLQSMFYSLEQRYLRLTDRMTKTERFVSHTYEVLSDFGRSIIRPLVGLLILIIAAALSIALIQSETLSRAAPVDWNLILDSVALSFRNVVLPFRTLLDPEAHPGVMIVSGIQSLCSTALLGLLALALRWQFKRD